MPEIAEVARAVHYIRKYLVGRTLEKVVAVEDANVFGKVGTSHTALMEQLTGKKVIDAGQQGKYFWMIMSSPPHPVMHFGMAGWLRFKSEHTFYYPKKDGEVQEWPPKYWRLRFETDGKGENKIEAAYVDLRRFGRVRLVDCPGKDIRKHSPLVENGPDPVQDAEIVTVDWLKELCRKRKAPIKAMLLNQTNISGIGNWVGDEIMYNAKMHPEQYSNTLSDKQIEQLHKSIHYICKTAVDLLADSDRFPEEWLFKHRWGKGKKDGAKKLPNGEKIVFLTVGGRTSAVIPSVQKNTGPVAIVKNEDEDTEEETPKSGKKRGAATSSTATSNKRVKAVNSKSAKKKPRHSRSVETDESEDDASEINYSTSDAEEDVEVSEADTEEEQMVAPSRSRKKATATTPKKASAITPRKPPASSTKKKAKSVPESIKAEVSATEVPEKKSKALADRTAEKKDKTAKQVVSKGTTKSTPKSAEKQKTDDRIPEAGRRRSGRLNK